MFADIQPDTLNIDVKEIEKKINGRTKAIVVVHYGGHACDMDRTMALARYHDVKVIEDTAHACGSEYKGRKCGSIITAVIGLVQLEKLKRLNQRRREIAQKL